MLSNSLRNFIFVLFCHLNQGVQFVEMNSGLNGSLNCSNPSFQLFLFSAFETFQVLGNPTGHLIVAQLERTVALVPIVLQIVWKQDEEFSSNIIVLHFMKKLHSFSSSTIS